MWYVGLHYYQLNMKSHNINVVTRSAFIQTLKPSDILFSWLQVQHPPLRIPVARRQTPCQQINKAHRDRSIHHVHSTEHHMPTTPLHCPNLWCIHTPPLAVQENKRSLITVHISRLSHAHCYMWCASYIMPACGFWLFISINVVTVYNFIMFLLSMTFTTSELPISMVPIQTHLMSLLNGINTWNTTLSLNSKSTLPPTLAHTAAADEPSTIPALAKPVLLYFL